LAAGGGARASGRSGSGGDASASTSAAVSARAKTRASDALSAPAKRLSVALPFQPSRSEAPAPTRSTSRLGAACTAPSM
jgi:hypothetical protein